jgi:hypothetical protein
VCRTGTLAKLLIGALGTGSLAYVVEEQTEDQRRKVAQLGCEAGRILTQGLPLETMVGGWQGEREREKRREKEGKLRERGREGDSLRKQNSILLFQDRAGPSWKRPVRKSFRLRAHGSVGAHSQQSKGSADRAKRNGTVPRKLYFCTMKD